MLSGPLSTATDSTTSARMSNILFYYKQECMPKGFQDTYNDVDVNIDIEVDHKITGTKLRIISTLKK